MRLPVLERVFRELPAYKKPLKVERPLEGAIGIGGAFAA
jgi:hypothetical protein